MYNTVYFPCLRQIHFKINCFFWRNDLNRTRNPQGSNPSPTACKAKVYQQATGLTKNKVLTKMILG